MSALGDVAAFGDFFRVYDGPRSGDWLPLRTLTEPAVVRRRVEVTAAAIAGLPAGRLGHRVALSTLSLGLFARVLSPPFGLLVVSGSLPVWSLDSLWWQPLPGGPGRLAVDPSARVQPGGDGVAALADGILVPVIEPLMAAFASAGVSAVTLRGNVASALGGAAVTVSAVRPDLADAAWALVAGLLTRPGLAGTATVGPGGRGLRRRSCCLFYRVAGGGLCVDCILAPA